jgi:uncharacterized circularly permuted ATP-grasp superfamily protein/uncharacterized alpha-E superfamily protein
MTLATPLATADPPDPAPRGLAESYAPADPAMDELTEPDGSLRSHWRPFVSMLDDLGRPELVTRWDQARRLIRENGITHNVYDDPDGLARPWNLDLLPLLLPSAEWKGLEAGLIQRARLLDRLLADVYGPGVAVAEGLLPPELVYGNPGFLRPCHGIRPPWGRWVHLYAADLVRGADGAFSVLADRTQGPSGAGYSLENRIVLNQLLPTVVAQCNVQRLAPFFIALRQMLTHLAPANRENPRVVLLTPGPYNETYFEHAYLAKYLGYTLVQGNDLTVRDGLVYLKTLGGLQRVDVILRRVDDAYCDPLELYPDSFLGVAGLLEAVRDGTVAVANALGSGFAEGPALLPFLPGLCRRLLGEELALPSVQTWWCGSPDDRRHVLANLPHMVFKPAFPEPGSDPVFGGDLSKAGRDELVADITARPAAWVAQERVATYRMPVFTNGDTQSRRFVLRVYLTATPDEAAPPAKRYAAMPGGLTRVTGAVDSLVVSLQKGGGSKDTWVLGDTPGPRVTLLGNTAAPVTLSRAGSDLPSRVADDLFWLGRYVQRADSIARLGRSVFSRLSDPNSVESPAVVRVLMRELVGPTDAPDHGPTAARELALAMFSSRDAAALRSAARRTHALARILRDRISSDAWRILQSVHTEMTAFDGRIDDDGAATVIDLLNRLVGGSLAFGGMAAESMTHGMSWRFLDMGFRVERGLSVARLIHGTLVNGSTDEPALLDAVLDVADSALTYRRRYLTRLDVTAVADLLLADESNPRSVAYQVKALDEHLGCLPRESNHPQRSPDHQAAVKLRTLLRLEDMAAACQLASGRRSRLRTVTTETIELLATVAENVGRIFFTHAAVTSQLTQVTPGEGA